jgi:hypothetical protein
MPEKEGAFAMTMKEEVNYSSAFADITKQIGDYKAQAEAINEYYVVAKRMALASDPKNKDYKQLKNEVIKKYKALQLQAADDVEDADKEEIVNELKLRGYAGTDEQVAYVISKRAK